jgi:hypothetical protein
MHTFPVRSCSAQWCTPREGALAARSRLRGWDDKRRYRNPCGSNVTYLVRGDAERFSARQDIEMVKGNGILPLYHIADTVEPFWSGVQDTWHVRECVDRGSLDDIKHCHARHAVFRLEETWDCVHDNSATHAVANKEERRCGRGVGKDDTKKVI